MNGRQALVQTSRPVFKVRQFDADTGNFDDVDDTLNDAVNQYLLSYSWSLSVSDTQGSFSATLFPGTVGSGKNRKANAQLYDSLNVMDVVEIYENVFNTSEENTLAGYVKREKVELYSGTGDVYTIDESSGTPVFIGVIKSKKYVAQVTDSGVSRRIQISGISAAGLLAQLHIDFSTTTMAIGDTLSANQGVFEGLTVNLTGYTNQDAREAGENTIGAIVNVVWDVFKEQAVKLSSGKGCQVVDMIDALGVEFSFDDSCVEYYLANIFSAETTQNIFDLTKNIAGEPVYETFATFDEEGKPIVNIRMVPFKSATWVTLTCWELEPITVKAFDFTQSDSEVYTVFFTYLDGYPVSAQTQMTISALMRKNNTDSDAAAEATQDDNLVAYNEDKYAIYGYRLMNASFRGYSKENGSTGDPREMMATMNQNMMLWFGHLDEMLTGSVSLAMTGTTSQIKPGERAAFLGCEFYIEGVAHSWECGRGGDINLNLTRGGKYTEGSFSQAEDFTSQTRLLEGLVAGDNTKEASE